jgi:hypothetical protein
MENKHAEEPKTRTFEGNPVPVSLLPEEKTERKLCTAF